MEREQIMMLVLNGQHDALTDEAIATAFSEDLGLRHVWRPNTIVDAAIAVIDQPDDRAVCRACEVQVETPPGAGDVKCCDVCGRVETLIRPGDAEFEDWWEDAA